MKILVVEDEEKLADTLVQLMEDQGYNATAVNDGQAAVDTIFAGPAV